MANFYLRLYCHTPSPEEGAWVDVNVLGVHPDLARRLAELGIIDYNRGFIPAPQVARLHRVLRLRQSLGVNLSGAAIIVELLERMEELQDELERLRR